MAVPVAVVEAVHVGAMHETGGRVALLELAAPNDLGRAGGGGFDRLTDSVGGAGAGCGRQLLNWVGARVGGGGGQVGGGRGAGLPVPSQQVAADGAEVGVAVNGLGRGLLVGGGRWGEAEG